MMLFTLQKKCYVRYGFSVRDFRVVLAHLVLIILNEAKWNDLMMIFQGCMEYCG